MSSDLAAFSHLPDDARLLVHPVENGLAAGKSAPVLAVLNELLAEWKRNRVIADGAVALLRDGAFLAIAYQPLAGDLSGCTKDSLVHTLKNLERMLGARILDAPRLAVEIAGKVQLMDHAGFKALRREGRVDDSTRVYNTLVATVGDLREGKFETTVGESWYSRGGA